MQLKDVQQLNRGQYMILIHNTEKLTYETCIISSTSENNKMSDILPLVLYS